jgi:hypothetical protein
MEYLVQEIVKSGGKDYSYAQQSNKDCNYTVEYKGYRIFISWESVELIHKDDLPNYRWDSGPSHLVEDSSITTVESLDNLINTLNNQKNK